MDRIFAPYTPEVAVISPQRPHSGGLSLLGNYVAWRALVFRVQLGAYRPHPIPRPLPLSQRWERGRGEGQRRHQIIHEPRRLFLHLVIQVTVDVHSDAWLGVSQYLGYHDHRDAVVEHQRSHRVTQDQAIASTFELYLTDKTSCHRTSITG